MSECATRGGEGCRGTRARGAVGSVGRPLGGRPADGATVRSMWACMSLPRRRSRQGPCGLTCACSHLARIIWTDLLRLSGLRVNAAATEPDHLAPRTIQARGRGGDARVEQREGGLQPGGQVRLRYGYVLTCDEVIKDEATGETHRQDKTKGKENITAIKSRLLYLIRAQNHLFYLDILSQNKII